MTRSTRENGGSTVTFCRAKTQRSRTRLLNAIVAVLFDEEPSQTFGADFRLDALRVEARASRVEERGVSEVGAEDLNGARGLRDIQELQERHGDGIRFLAGRTSGHPDANARSLWLAVDDRGKDLPLENLEHLGIAEEAGDVDQDVAIERVGFGAVTVEKLRVLRR